MTHYWSCVCGERWPRSKQLCTCGRRRPKRKVPKHARTLRDDSYDEYTKVAADAHGVTNESCCVCGRARHEAMRHHREHDHVTGLPRGIVCFQCNGLMPRLLTLDRARLIVAYLERVEAFYGERDPQLAEAYPSMAVMQREAARGVRELSARKGTGA